MFGRFYLPREENHDGSVVYTDHWSGYNGLGEAGFMGSEALQADGSQSPEHAPFPVLALDGGGMRGIFTAALLAGGRRHRRPVVDHFDLAVGTSTEGVISLALGAGLGPHEVLEFYLSEKDRISPIGSAGAPYAASSRPSIQRARWRWRCSAPWARRWSARAVHAQRRGDGTSRRADVQCLAHDRRRPDPPEFDVKATIERDAAACQSKIHVHDVDKRGERHGNSPSGVQELAGNGYATVSKRGPVRRFCGGDRLLHGKRCAASR